MRKKLYRLEFFYLFDHTGIQRHLEEMAAKGWLLEKLGAFWRYRRIEPQRLHFAITYFPEASVYDPEPREGQWDYQELCRDAGWTHTATQGQMQVFYTKAESPVPLETDPQIQVENIHRTMRRSQVPYYLGMMFIGLLQLGLQWQLYRTNPIDWLCGTSGIAACFCWVMLCGVSLLTLADYFRWHHRAQAEAREGRFTPTFSRTWLQTAVLALVLAVLVLWGVSTRGTRLGTFSVLYALATMVIVFGVTIVVNKLLKRRKATAMANRWGTALAAGLATMIFMGWSISYILNSGRLREGHTAETYTAYGITWDAYDDPIPLRIEDLTDTDYVRWSTKAETQASPFMAQYEYNQEARMGDPDQPELFYTVLDVKWSFLYNTAENAILQEAEQYNNLDFPEFWRSCTPTDPAPWGALRAYQIRRGGEAQDSYLLCYENHLATIAFYNWGTLTQEQMAKAGEILGKA